MPGKRKAGEAFVEIGLRDQITGQLKKLGNRIKSFAAGVSNIAASIGRASAGIAGLGAGALTSLSFATNEAGDFNETVSAFEATFKVNSKAIRDWAQTYARQVGRTEQQTLNALTSFQGFFGQMGFGAEQAAELSKTMAALSVDFASFRNLDDEVSRQALLGGLLGNVSDTLLSSGVDVRATSVNKELESQGIDPRGASEQAKIAARLSIITKGLSDAQGDALKTSGSYNNQVKALNAAYLEAKIALGTALLPAFKKFIAFLKQGLRFIQEWVKSNEETVRAIAKMVAKVTAGAAAVAALAAAFSATAAGVAAIANPIGALVASVAALSAGVLTLTGNWKAAIGSIAETFQAVNRHVDETIGAIMDAFASGDLKNAVKVIWAEIKFLFRGAMVFIAGAWDQMVTGMYGAIDTMIVNVTNSVRVMVRDVLEGLKKVARAASDIISVNSQVAGAAGVVEGALSSTAGVDGSLLSTEGLENAIIAATDYQESLDRSASQSEQDLANRRRQQQEGLNTRRGARLLDADRAATERLDAIADVAKAAADVRKATAAELKKSIEEQKASTARNVSEALGQGQAAAKESTRLTKGTFSSVALARGFIAGDSPEQENQRNIRETREILEDIRRQQREQLVALGL